MDMFRNVGNCLYLNNKTIVNTFLLILCLSGCSYINEKLNLKDDHFIEEALEEKIEDETGFDFDLTPRSPENTDAKEYKYDIWRRD